MGFCAVGRRYGLKIVCTWALRFECPSFAWIYVQKKEGLGWFLFIFFSSNIDLRICVPWAEDLKGC